MKHTREWHAMIVQENEAEIKKLTEAKIYFMKQMLSIFTTREKADKWDLAYDLATFKIKKLSKQITKINKKYNAI